MKRDRGMAFGITNFEESYGVEAIQHLDRVAQPQQVNSVLGLAITTTRVGTDVAAYEIRPSRVVDCHSVSAM